MRLRTSPSFNGIDYFKVLEEMQTEASHQTAKNAKSESDEKLELIRRITVDEKEQRTVKLKSYGDKADEHNAQSTQLSTIRRWKATNFFTDKLKFHQSTSSWSLFGY